MNFYGIQKTSLIDFPKQVASTLFTFGCNLRCPYCHNPELLENKEKLKPIQWDVIKAFLLKRKNVLGGICITGGEPLLQKELPEVIKEIKKLGLKVKIDTNGTLPEELKKLDADFIAMDIKTSFSKYKLMKYTGTDNIEELLKESIDWIIKSKIPHEFRTTVVPDIVTIDDIQEIVKEIKGADKYVLAQFRPQNTLDPNFENIKPYLRPDLEAMKNIVKKSGIPCQLRTSQE